MSRKSIVVIVSVVVLGAAGFALVKFRNGGPTGIEVQTALAERTTIVQTVTGTGRIQPKTQVNISADVSAKITRLEVDEGDWVEKGQFLLELDRERYLAAVESSEASLRVAQANANLTRENMIKAGKDYGRIKELHERELESQAQLDAMYAAYEVEKARHQSAKSQVEQAEAALKQSRDSLSKTTIYAPMSGTVSKLNKEVGEIALGSQFQEDVIMVISNLSGMEALVDVDENDIVAVAIGDEATIEVDALPDLVLHGVVTEIANSAKVSSAGTTDQKTEFEVKIAVTDPNPELRPGMTASGNIVAETRTEALGVPIQSVSVRTPEQLLKRSKSTADDGTAGDEFVPDKDGFVEVVFVVGDGTATAKQVTTGIQSETHIEILSGLVPGEEIVVGNYRAISKDLEHGSTVIVENEAGDASATRAGR